MIKRGPQPVVISCGCWQCKACAGKGHTIRTEGAKEIREDCAACAGWGHEKLCVEHAKISNWIAEKTKTR